MEDKKIVPRIEGLTIKNYRALKHLQLRNITPLSVFLGPNGSGKSTLFDVFAFLSECFSIGLRKAWDNRGRMKELRTRGAEGPIEIELKYRERQGEPLITYYISFDEKDNSPIVAKELLYWKQASKGRPYYLDFKLGKGSVVDSEKADNKNGKIKELLDAPDKIAVNALGQFQKYTKAAFLRRFITDWHLSNISIDNTRLVSNAGAQEHLSISGDNLPNVILYLFEKYPSISGEIFEYLSKKIPGFETIVLELMIDGRLLLRLKDRFFSEPILAKYVSDGTLKLLALMTLLKDPLPAKLTCIEEPENQIHPRLLYELSEELREASVYTQLFIATHSPYLINQIRPEELWIFDRNEKGFTTAKRAIDMLGIKEMYRKGGNMGFLWMENYFEFGDPLQSSRLIK